MLAQLKRSRSLRPLRRLGRLVLPGRTQRLLLGARRIIAHGVTMNRREPLENIVRIRNVGSDLLANGFTNL